MAKTVVVQAQQRWEYCCESRRTESSLMPAINDRGQQGWELVDGVHHKDPKGEMLWAAFLKRPSAGPSSIGGMASGFLATVASPTPAPEENTSEPQGFGLSGDEFQIREEPKAE
jgi:hypothetical protein